MNTENSQPNEAQRFKINLADKTDLINPNNKIDLVNLSIYYKWKNIKNLYCNNNFKIYAPIADIHDYFDYTDKKTWQFSQSSYHKNVYK